MFPHAANPSKCWTYLTRVSLNGQVVVKSCTCIDALVQMMFDYERYDIMHVLYGK